MLPLQNSELQNSEPQDGELRGQSHRQPASARLVQDVVQYELDDRQCYELEASSFNLQGERLFASAAVLCPPKEPNPDYKTTGIANLLRWRSAQIAKECCE